jgi:glutathione S-transferase
MLTIYGRATSSNTQLVMWAIGELGLDYERLDYGGAFGKTDTPEYRAMNPMGLVPVARDGGLTMFESGAILRYLGARYGAEPFWPADPAKRAAVDVWAEWGKVTLAPAITAIFVRAVRTPPSKHDPKAIAEAVAGADRLLAMLADWLRERPWLAGNDFTYADIPAGYLLYRYYNMPVKRSPIPAIDAYYARLQERPAFRTHSMVNFDSLYVRD